MCFHTSSNRKIFKFQIYKVQVGSLSLRFMDINIHDNVPKGSRILGEENILNYIVECMRQFL